MTWDQDLVTASFRGFEFQVASVSDSWEREVVAHRYLYRDGAELDDTGRSPRPTSFKAIFTGANYLQDLTDFIRLCDEGETGTLVHPLLGQWQAKCRSLQAEQSHERRDTAIVDVEFIEDAVGSQQQLLSASAAMAAMVGDLIAVQAEQDLLDAPVPEVDSFISNSQEFTDDAAATEDDLLPRLEQMLGDLENTLDALDELYGPAALHKLRTACFQVLNRAREIKAKLERVHPKVIVKNLSATVPLAVLALKLFGKPDRGDELLRLNNVRDPFLVKPGPLKVYGG